MSKGARYGFGALVAAGLAGVLVFLPINQWAQVC